MNLIFRKRLSIQLKFVFVVVLSLLLIITDSKFSKLIKIRLYMDTAISPLYYLISSSNHLISNIISILIQSSQLILENQILHKELLIKNSEQILLDKYKNENIKLRSLLGSPLTKNEKKMLAEVIYINYNLYSYQIILDKGLKNGVYIGQPVINDKGIVGQVISVNNLTSKVLLICDSSHSLPVQILRNNIRMIINGNGLNKDLKVECLPSNIDVKIGDLLVTSGLGGCFPKGYLVGVISLVKKNTEFDCITIQAHPSADLNNLHYLLLLWNANSYNKEFFFTPERIHKIANYRLNKSKRFL